MQLVASFKRQAFLDSPTRVIVNQMVMTPLFSSFNPDLAVHAVHALGCMFMEGAFTSSAEIMAFSQLVDLVEKAKNASFRNRSMWALANMVDVVIHLTSGTIDSIASPLLKSSFYIALDVSQKYEAVSLSSPHRLAVS